MPSPSPHRRKWAAPNGTRAAPPDPPPQPDSLQASNGLSMQTVSASTPKSSAGIRAHARSAENACPAMRSTATCVYMMPAESPGHVGRISRAILPQAMLDAGMIMPDHIHETIVIRNRGEACVPFHVCKSAQESDASQLRTRLAHVTTGHAEGRSPSAFFLLPHVRGSKGV